MRQRFWTLVVVVMMVMAGGIVRAQALFPQGPSCPPRDGYPLEIVCNLTNKEDQMYVLHTTTNSTRFNTFTVIGASSLEIEEQCNLNTSEIIVVDSLNIRTTNTREPCVVVPLKVRLRNSKAKDISHVAGTIRLEGATAESINLDSVNQFDFDNAIIEDISIQATKYLSTIFYSSIVNVNKMVINGTFRFEAENSNFTNVVGFIYNSINKVTSHMQYVSIERVYTEGIIITAGKFLMDEVTFTTLDSKSLVLNGETELTIRNSNMVNVRVDSLYIERGTVKFKNVTIGSSIGISFSYTADSKAGIMPLAIVLGCTTSLLWILGIVISTVVGAMVGGITIYFVMRKTKLLQTIPQDKSGMELLEFEDKPSSQSLNLSTQPQHSAPPPPVPPPPSHLKNKEEEEEEECLYYDEVLNPGQGNNNHIFPNTAPPLPPGPSPQPPRKFVQGNEGDEEDVYEEFGDPHLWPQNPHQLPPSVPPQGPLPGLPGTLPTLHGRSPGVPNIIPGSSNFPPKPFIPDPTSKASPSSSNLLNKNRGNTNNSKPPPPPPIRKDSAKQGNDFRDLPPPPKPLDDLDDYDDVCENLPPPPKPLDDLDDYDDVQIIYSDAQKPVVPMGKPSFLHKPSSTSLKVKPTGGSAVSQVLQNRRWPPPHPPQPPSQGSTIPSSPNFSGGEDYYEEL